MKNKCFLSLIVAKKGEFQRKDFEFSSAPHAMAKMRQLVYDGFRIAEYALGVTRIESQRLLAHKTGSKNYGK